MECFIRIVKLDEESRLIHGRMVPEAPERSQGAIPGDLDYDSAKPALRDWSKACEDTTGGRSKGDVRAMHGTLVAGEVVDLAFSDAERTIGIVVKVVDDKEWRKCAEGCYTGFAVAGGDAGTWQGGSPARRIPRMTELSLVDRPSRPPPRRSTLHKADGSAEKPLLFWDIYRESSPKPLMFNDLYAQPGRKGHRASADVTPPPLHKSAWIEAQHPRNEKGEFVALLARAAEGAEGAWAELKAMVDKRLPVADESMAGPDGESRDGNQALSEQERARPASPRGPIQKDTLPGPEPSPYPLGWPVINPTYWKRNPRTEWGA